MKKIIMTVIVASVLLSACNNYGEQTAEISADTTVKLSADERAFNFYFEYGKIVITSYTGSDTSITIPETISGRPVERIYQNAFENSDITEITLPSTFTSIPVLCGADKLETINIPKTFEEIDPKEINNYENLKNINAEAGGAFMSVDGVLYSADGKTLVYYPVGRTEEFTVPDSVEIIGKNAFLNSKAAKVSLGSGVKQIGSYAFYQSKLADITLNESLETIDDYAFSESRIKNILLPANLRSIGYYAFEGCQISKIALPEGLTEIGGYAFASTLLTELYLPDSIESCGKLIWDGTELAVSAPLSASYMKGTKSLLEMPDVTFRGDNDLHRAMRSAFNYSDSDQYKGRIYIDIDGDNFPERFDVWDNYAGVYKYDSQNNYWFYIICRIPVNVPLDLYYDKNNDEYFYIFCENRDYGGPFVYKYPYPTKRYMDYLEYSIGSFDEYSCGVCDEESGEYKTYAYVMFGGLDGKYYIGENEPDFYDRVISEAFSKYEIVSSFDLAGIIEQYGNIEEDEKYEIAAGEFADSPQPSPYFSENENSEEPLIRIGRGYYTENADTVYLGGMDISPETIDMLSCLPNLTTLDIDIDFWNIEDVAIDLNGLSKLTGLRELHVYGGEIKNAAEIGKLPNLTVLYMTSKADDLSFLTEMDSLVVIKFTDGTVKKPEDFYSPLYKMKNLRYLLVSTWDIGITEEQEAHIAANAPYINICKFKRG